MATQAQVQKFIKELATLAQAERKKRKKWVLPSVCIAQAALETGWGTSSLMTKAKAYFGIKATKSWKGKVYSSKTKECYDGENFTDITACFRAYDSVADSVADYYDLITKSTRYKAVVNETDAKKAITAIKNGGYATDPNYVTQVMNIIKCYNLTQYDKVEATTTQKKYYKKYTGDSYKIDEVFEAIGVPSKYCRDKSGETASVRKPIAKANGIVDYKGTATQNMKLVNLAKKGKLVKL